MFAKVVGNIEDSNRNKYLIFDSTQLHSIDENEEVLKMHRTLGWD